MSIRNGMIRVAVAMGLALLCSYCPVAGSAPVPCEIRVVSTPEQASLFFDKAPQVITPATVQAQEGEHLVVVRKDGYDEFRSTVVVTPGQTKMLVEARLEPLHGLVLIVTDPPGAEIMINKSQRGNSPLAVTDLVFGKYRVTAFLRGYFLAEKELVVEDGVPQKLEISLKSNFGTVVVDSEPAGAEVSVNGVPKGRTPCKVSGLQVGDAEVTVSTRTYKPYRQTVRLRAGDEIPVKAVLEPVAGSLAVNSTPEGALVYVDNERRGRTPVVVENLSTGEHRVRVEAEGYEPLARTVAVRQAERVSEDFGLEKNSGMIEITTRPAGVRVYIDGKDRGVTGVETGQTDAVSSPMVIDLLTEGLHTVQLSRKGFESQSVALEITRNQTATIAPELKRIFIPDTVVKTGARPEDSFTGYLVQRYESGDVKLELKPGVFRVFQARDIVSVEPLRTAGRDEDR